MTHKPATIAVRDHVLWISHLKGDDKLALRLEALAPGETIELEVDGLAGEWQKMQAGGDGRPTQGLRPASEASRSAWHDLQADRGRTVAISLADVPPPPFQSFRRDQDRTSHMALIIKCPPTSVDLDGQCLVTARLHPGSAPTAGAAAFLWFSETKGGDGLAHRGRVMACSDGNPVTLALQLDDAGVTQPLRKADLAAVARGDESTPLATLSAKLYWHAHDKVVDLTADEADYLNGRFAGDHTETIPPWETITEEMLTELAQVTGDGRRMYLDTATYRLTTVEENPDADAQRKPGTLRGIAADFIRHSGGEVVGRVLHYYMLTAVPDRKWDHGYVHAKSGPGQPLRGGSRDWIRPVND